ncbi:MULTISPECIES: hypothetical protein [unclassified Frigoribacterium]|uniref:hypothetical protein n=1 Tax=unclassified Frigoribacterium TaxID=2627005 RepID=UPI0012FAC36C|nr:MULTISPECIES: hypothetical protein [unclassified Frigoribacterium]
MEAQPIDGVWGGRNPNRLGEFESRGFFVNPRGVELEGTGASHRPARKLDANHALVAHEVNDNAVARAALKEEIHLNASK